MSVSSEERVERIPAAAGVEQIPATVGITLAAFYDKRAPAALAYCARACPPEGIADAVEAAFARLFEVASSAEEVELDELDAHLRAAVRAESVARTPPPESRGRRFERGARCEDVPRLLAARAGGELSEADAAARAGTRSPCWRCSGCSCSSTSGSRWCGRSRSPPSSPRGRRTTSGHSWRRSTASPP